MSVPIPRGGAWALSLLMLAGAGAPPCTDEALCKCPMASVPDELARSETVFQGAVAHVGQPAGEFVVKESHTGTDGGGFPIITVTFGWEGPQDVPVTLGIDRAWKGAVAGDTVVVLDAAVCGVGFQTGQTYVVYAMRVDGALRTSYCTRTRSLPHAADEARVLDSIARAPRP